MTHRLAFTKSAIEGISLPPEGSRAVVYDTKIPKLAIRLTHAGSRTFYVVKRTEDGISWVKLGVYPDMTPEGARKAAERVLGEIAKGINPAKAKRLEREKLTFGQAYQEYRERYLIPRGKKTTDDIQALWERCLGTMPDEPAKKHGRKRTKHPAGVDWSKRKLDAINNADVRRLHSNILAKHPTMANRVIELVRVIYAHAIKLGFSGSNPASEVEEYKETKRERFLESGELPRFFSALAEDSSKDFKDFALLALLTGARRTNILSMRWKDVDFERSVWRISETKNGSPQEVPLVEEATAILQERKPANDEAKSPYVFAAKSKSGYMTPPKKRWQALLKRASLEDLRIHDLRRSLGSWQAITGASLVIIGKSLGHKSPNSTMIYARLNQDAVRSSISTATSAMLEAAGVKTSGTVASLTMKRA
jgi:integrase